MADKLPPVGTEAVTNFDKASQQMLKDADLLGKGATAAIKKSGDTFVQAGDEAKKAGAHLLGAVANVGLGAAHGLKGTGNVAAGVGLSVAGGALAVDGAVVYGVEEGAGGLGWVAHKAAKGLANAGNYLNSIVGNGKMATVKEVQGQGGERFSSMMFDDAGKLLKAGGQQMQAAWGSYTQAVSHALGAGVNVLHVAGYTGLAAKDVIVGTAQAGEAGLVAGASQLAKTAAVAMQAAENGVEGAAALCQITAEFTAAMGNVLNEPKGGKQMVIEANKARQVYDMKIQELFKRNPELMKLPAYKEYMATAGAQ